MKEYSNGSELSVKKQNDHFLFALFLGLVPAFVFAFLLSKVFIEVPQLGATAQVSQPAGVFLADSLTIDQIRNKYQAARFGQGQVKVLIVPGHDNVKWGTEFRGVKEADMNADLGADLVKDLSADSLFNVTLARDRNGFIPELQKYFDDNAKEIEVYANEHKNQMAQLEQEGVIDSVTGVYHNNAPSRTVLQLYGINKWASENHYDIVLHVHFNDYPGRKLTSPGKYTGFVIYVPEKQYSNAKVSNAVAQSIFSELKKTYVVSNLPVENKGVVEDQNLIALGNANTLDPAGLLIEYGYIYERHFLGATTRAKTLQDMADKSAVGIENFFENKK